MSSLPSGLGNAFMAGLPGWIVGGVSNWMAQQATQPGVDAALGTRNPRDAVPLGYGTPDTWMPPRGRNPDVDEALGRVGGNRWGREGGAFMLPSQPGQQDIFAANFDALVQQYNTQRTRELELRGQVGEYEGAMETGLKDYADAYNTVEAEKSDGLKFMEDMYKIGQFQLKQASQTSRENLTANLERIDQQLADFSRQSNELMERAEGLRAESLEGYADRTAQLLEDKATAFEHRLAMQKAEVLGRADIPVAAREAMAQRLSEISSQQLRSEVATTQASESIRYSQLQVATGDQINSLGAAISNAAGAIGGAGITGVTTAFEVDTEAQQALADAAAQSGFLFANMASDYRAKMTTTMATLKTGAASFRIAGETDVYNMLMSIPRAYVDLSGLFEEAMGLNLAVDEAEFQRMFSEYGIVANQHGLQVTSSQPHMLAGTAGATNQLLAEMAPSPETTWMDDWGGDAISAGTGLATGYWGRTIPSAQSPG